MLITGFGCLLKVLCTSNLSVVHSGLYLDDEEKNYAVSS